MTLHSDDERLYVIHENHLGERRYQPRLDMGHTAWREGDEHGGWVEWSWGSKFSRPLLHRSIERAERFALREMRHREKQRRNEFKEVPDE